jgi:hypothetical protein
MVARRVVTGQSPEGKAVAVSDEVVAEIPIGDQGSGITLLWGRDGVAQFPDDGSPPALAAAIAPLGGSRCAIMELAPVGDEFHEFVRSTMSPWADPDHPGMHRTPTIDYDIVLGGTVGLELDDGQEVILEIGDIVVQNATRHRWHNRGTGVARVLSVMLGAEDQRL